ncbi:PucR family transcriptional regulator [Brevibacillus sp. B_LB10_24]|uniref:PucR family transcriptional regulator n=1 Tax=Brevibacillus sp. B_LB10_24 TaxID=3380645 RepID=UPI0038B7B2FE
MIDRWRQEIERIRHTTSLPIELIRCSLSEWEAKKRQYELTGGKVVISEVTETEVWFVSVSPDVWPESALALLPLLLQREPDQAKSDQEGMRAWLKACYLGQIAPVPIPLQTSWNWVDERICFILERTKLERSDYMAAWLELLTDFFDMGQRLELYPLTDTSALLLLPLSLLSEVKTDTDTGELLRQSLLEWAAGIHDLISTEAMENARVFVAPPIRRPEQLAEALRELASLSRAAKRFLPKAMVAATWQYRLEMWVAELPEQAVTLLRQTLPWAIRLSAEQRETLAALCSHNLNISETARALYIHRNTLLYRLDRLKETTGLDPRQFSDALLLRLALLFGQNR